MAVLRRSAAAASAAVLAETALLDSGFIDIYDGTMPATVATAVTTQVKLARLTLAADAFTDANADGVAVAGTIGDGTGLANGTATWARWVTSASAGVYDTDVTLTAGNGYLKLDNTTIAIGDTVTAVAAGTITMPLT
jgi:hypothetical protein